MKYSTSSFKDNGIDSDLKNQIEFERSSVNALINNLSGLMWSVDNQYRLITSNSAFDAMTMHMSGHKIKKGDCVFSDGFTPEQLSKFKQYYDRAFAGETFTVMEFIDEPVERWSEISFYPIRQDYSVVGTACYAHDITQSKQTEAKLVRANRLYQFISEVNHAIVHSADEQTLFHEICAVAAGTGEFELACIDSLDIENGKLHLAAQCNATPADIATFSNISYTRNGPIDRIISTGKYYVINDFGLEPEQSFWRQYAFSRDFRSAISLPIKVDGKIKYLLCLFSLKTYAFDREEITLLEKAVADISFALDVLEKGRRQVQTSKELAHKEARLKHAQFVAHIGYWELDFSNSLATWSEEHCRIYGVDAADNMHSYESWLSFVHPDDRDHVLHMSKEGEASMRKFSFYHRIVRKNGSVRHIHSQNEFVFNAEGVPVGMFGASQDVTGIKLAEEKLKHSTFRFNQAQAITHLGNWELDFATGMGIWSAETCRIYGLPVTENVQAYEAWVSFIHPDDLEHVMQENNKAAATQGNSSIYHRIIRRDGTIRHIHSQAHFEFDSEGKPAGLYGTAHDITEQKMNIMQLQAQNEQLKEIAWIQSHKIRGPLATMLGLAQLFKSGYATNTEEIVDGILVTSEKLDAVIHEIVGKTHVAKVHDIHVVNC